MSLGKPGHKTVGNFGGEAYRNGLNMKAGTCLRTQMETRARRPYQKYYDIRLGVSVILTMNGSFAPRWRPDILSQLIFHK